MFAGFKKVLENLATPRQIPERPLSLACVVGGFGILAVAVISMIAIANYQIAERLDGDADVLRQAIAGEQLNTDRIRNEIRAVEYEQNRIGSLTEISRSQLNELTPSIGKVESDIATISSEIVAVEEEISSVEGDIAGIRKELK